MTKWIGVLSVLAFALACTDDVTQPSTDAVTNGVDTSATHKPSPESDVQHVQGVVPAVSYGAVVHHNEGAGIPFGGCSMLDGAGMFFPADFSLPCGTEVATFSDGMNATISVQAKGVPNPTGATVLWGPYNVGGTEWAAQFDGSIPGFPILDGPPYPCFLLGTDYDLANPLWTVKWSAHVTPGGNASLVCQYSEKWAFHCEDYGNCAVAAP